MSKEWEPQNVFDVLGNEIARKILALASVQPISATKLAEHCDVSEPTIYRRITALQEYDMLDEQTAIDDGGHHYKRYRTTLKEARIRVEEGQYNIDIELKKDYVDKFTGFWNDLEKGSQNVRQEMQSDGSQADGTSSDLSDG
jgi:DNA-binding transcriptional ArsR family regulator